VSIKALLEKHHWVSFVLPMAVFMLVGSLEPTAEKPGGQAIGLAIPYRYYPWIYTAKIALCLAAIGFVLPGYRKFPLRVGPLAVPVGVVGVVIWVGLCSLNLEKNLLAAGGLDWLVGAGERSGFNPFEQLQAYPLWAWGFLAIRFLGLVVVIALIEEFFLRGFVMRLVVAADWWNVPLGKVTTSALLVGTLLPMAMHPAELFAAAAWFSLLTWLMVKTRNIWDCVVAHAVTNLLLGIYVVASGEWHLM